MHHKSKLWAYVADIYVSAVYAYAFISSRDQNMFIFLIAMIYVLTTRCYLGKCQHVISYSMVAYMLSSLRYSDISITTKHRILPKAQYFKRIHSRSTFKNHSLDQLCNIFCVVRLIVPPQTSS